VLCVNVDVCAQYLGQQQHTGRGLKEFRAVAILEHCAQPEARKWERLSAHHT